MKQPKFWSSRRPCFLSCFLSPFSAIWQAVTRSKQKKQGYMTNIPVICVGNITIGGAGKTPTAIAIAKAYKSQGLSPVFLSRGYGSSNKEPIMVDPKIHHAKDVGDEPLLLAQYAPCFVCTNRATAAQAIEQWGEADVIIMDDGMQNPKLHKDFTLLVMDGNFAMGNGHIIPAGPLRESLSDGLKRTQAVLIIGDDIHKLQEQINQTPVFSAHIEAQLQSLDFKQHYLAFAGLARPEKFRQTLLQHGFSLLNFVEFADHHPFTKEEIHNLLQQATAQNAKLITTEKDMMRIAPELQQHITYLPITLPLPSTLTSMLPLLGEHDA